MLTAGGLLPCADTAPANNTNPNPKRRNKHLAKLEAQFNKPARRTIGLDAAMGYLIDNVETHACAQ